MAEQGKNLENIALIQKERLPATQKMISDYLSHSKIRYKRRIKEENLER